MKNTRFSKARRSVVPLYGDNGSVSHAIDPYFSQKIGARVLERGTRGGLENVGMMYELFKLLKTPSYQAQGRFDLSGLRLLEQANGKRAKLVRRWYKRGTADYVDGNCATGCDFPEGTSAKPYFEDEVTLKKRFCPPVLLLDEAELRNIPEGREQWFSDRFLDHVSTFEKAFVKHVSEYMVDGGFIGNYPSQVAPVGGVVEVPIFMANGLTVNPVGTTVLQELAKYANNTDGLVIIGGAILSGYQKAVGLRSPNQLGFNPALAEVLNSTYRDEAIVAKLAEKNPALGTSGALAIRPGAISLLTAHDYEGEQAVSTDNTFAGSWTSPYTGLTYGLFYERKHCKDGLKHAYSWHLIWDLVGYPACWTDDPCLQGITDAYAVKLVCSDTGFCNILPISNTECGPVATSNVQPDAAPAAASCLVPCRALFAISQKKMRKWTATVATSKKITAIKFGTQTFLLSGYAGAGFDTAVPADVAAMVAQINNMLGGNGEVIDATNTGASLAITIVSATNVSDVQLIDAAGADVNLTQAAGVKKYAVITEGSSASTGATVTNLNWTIGALAPFNGARDSYAPASATGVNGMLCRLWIEQGVSGGPAANDAITLAMTDSVACTSTATDLVTFPA